MVLNTYAHCKSTACTVVECRSHTGQIEAAHVAIASAVAAAAAHCGSTTEGTLPATVNVLRTLRDKVCALHATRYLVQHMLFTT
jgi:hypothetical protein